MKQGKGDVGAMKKTIELLQTGGNAVLVFPEGASDAKPAELQEIAAGAALDGEARQGAGRAAR